MRDNGDFRAPEDMDYAHGNNHPKTWTGIRTGGYFPDHGFAGPRCAQKIFPFSFVVDKSRTTLLAQQGANPPLCGVDSDRGSF